MYLSVYISIYPCIYLSMYLCIYASMHVPIYLCIYLSVCQRMYDFLARPLGAALVVQGYVAHEKTPFPRTLQTRR